MRAERRTSSACGAAPGQRRDGDGDGEGREGRGGPTLPQLRAEEASKGSLQCSGRA